MYIVLNKWYNVFCKDLESRTGLLNLLEFKVFIITHNRVGEWLITAHSPWLIFP